MDEIAFINYNWRIVPTATSSMLKASEMARRAGIPSPMIYTTTAGNPDTRAGAFALSIFENACPFAETMYDLKDRAALMAIVENNSTNHMLYLEFSYRQLGKTDAWFEDAARRSNASQDDINRDLLNIWQSSTDKSVIPKDLLNKIRQSKRDPYFSQLEDGFVIRWYIPRDAVENGNFTRMSSILGTDTSENIGRDFTTFTCISPIDGSVIFTCRCNDSNVMLIERFVANMLIRYPKMVWIPERQSTAAGIIDHILEEFQRQRINPFFRIYNEVIQNYGDPAWKDVDVYNYDNLYGKVRAAFGYRTSGGSVGTARNVLYKQTMFKTLELNHSRIYDARLINEYCGLEMRNGRVDHSKDGHDDQVISHLLASFLLFFGKNLQMYGIDTGTLMSRVDLSGKEVDPVARSEQIRIRKRISELEALLSVGLSHILAETYKRELQSLREMVDDSIAVVDPIAVSQVKEQERQIRQQTGSSEEQLRSFANRWNYGWQQRLNR